MSNKTISINRAPVLALWATVVAERLGYKEDEALSLGKALTGLTAQAKGRRLGIIHAREPRAGKSKPRFVVQAKIWLASARQLEGRLYSWRCRMRAFFVVMIATMNYGVGSAGAADETLKFYLSRSQYALAGEVLAEPVKQPKPFRWWGDEKQPPLTVYEVRVKVLDQFQYQSVPYAHKEMTAYILIPEGAVRPGPLKKGVKCVLFVDWVFGGPGGSTSFITVDPWFGVQNYDPKMAERLTEQGKRPPKTN